MRGGTPWRRSLDPETEIVVAVTLAQPLKKEQTKQWRTKEKRFVGLLSKSREFIKGSDPAPVAPLAFGVGLLENYDE